MAADLELTAIERGVPDVAAGYEINHVFRDVGGVITDALEILGDQD